MALYVNNVESPVITYPLVDEVSSTFTGGNLSASGMNEFSTQPEWHTNSASVGAWVLWSGTGTFTNLRVNKNSVTTSGKYNILLGSDTLVENWDLTSVGSGWHTSPTFPAQTGNAWKLYLSEDTGSPSGWITGFRGVWTQVSL